MPPVRSVKNQYFGINAHLHSALQGTGEWSDFHQRHNAHLADILMLPLRSMGYVTSNEVSLQLRRIEDDHPRSPRADVVIRDVNPGFRGESIPILEGVPALRLSDIGELDEDTEFQYYAVAIRESSPNFQQGALVAWIELLSPSRLLMEQGVVFVEIDYLHETPSTFRLLPSYPQFQDNAHPYRIVILDPRPIYRNTRVYLYEFDVDDALPEVMIPLNGDDVLQFDFGLPYQWFYERAFYGDRIDYTQLPLNFDRYSPADQQRIANRMICVLEAARRSVDLETGPFPLDTLLPLDEALKRIESLGQ
jgi:hypothetical protein